MDLRGLDLRAAVRKVSIPQRDFDIRAYGRRVARDAVSALAAAPLLLLVSAAYVAVVCVAMAAGMLFAVEFFELDRWMGLVLHAPGASR